HSDNYPVVTDSFHATVVWMAEQPMLPGKLYDLKLGPRTVSGRFRTLQYQIDVNTLEKGPAPVLELNGIGECEIHTEQLVCVDNYNANRSTGAFIVIDRLTNATVGAGMISVTQEDSNVHTTSSRSTVHVTREERAARYGQNPATVVFTGLSGSGK